MPVCLKCGKKLPDEAKFCIECGKPVENHKTGWGYYSQRTDADKIRKCPQCRSDVQSFRAICPGCGYEMPFRVSQSVVTFIDRINTFDKQISISPKTVKNGWSSWNIGQRFAWIILNLSTYWIPLMVYLIVPMFKKSSNKALSDEEKNKASFIENYTFANDREAIMEALLYIEAKLDFIATHHIDRKAIYWERTWTAKAKQVYHKASIILSGDKDADDTFNNILKKSKQIRREVRKRTIIVGLLLIMSGISFIMFGVAVKNKENTRDGSGVFAISSKWPSEGLAAMLPSPKSKDRLFIRNSDKVLEIDVDDMYSSDRAEYIRKCKEKGFTLHMKEDVYSLFPVKKEEMEFAAYNSEGYYLVINKLSSGADMKISLFAPDDREQIIWDTIYLAQYIPEIATAVGNVKLNTNDGLWMRVLDISPIRYIEYVSACNEKGFVIDTVEEENAYYCYNKDGYCLKLDYIADLSYLTIEIEPPEATNEINWPNSSLVKLIPKPKSTKGRISSERDDYFSVYISNMTIDDYRAYVNQCIDKGFNVDYSRYDNSYYAKNKKGYYLKVKYEKGLVMYISIEAP